MRSSPCAEVRTDFVSSSYIHVLYSIYHVFYFVPCNLSFTVGCDAYQSRVCVCVYVIAGACCFVSIVLPGISHREVHEAYPVLHDLQLRE